MRKYYSNIESWFIGDYLHEERGNIFETSKIRLIFHFTLLSTGGAILSIPLMYSVNAMAFGFSLFALFLLCTIPFLLKFTKSVATTGKLLFSLTIFNLVHLYLLLNKIDSMGIGAWIIAVIIISSFTIGRRWGLFYFIIAALAIVTMTTFQINEFSLYFDDFRYNPMASNNALYKLPILIVMPIAVVFLIIQEVLNSKVKSEEKMNEMVEKQNALIMKLRDSESMYKMFFEDADDMIYLLDGMGKFNYANPAFEKVGGYTLEELKDYNFNFFVKKEFRPELQMAIYNQVKEQREIGYQEFPIIGKDGNEVWIGQKVKMIFQDKWLIKAICIGRDITQAKKTEIELIKAKEEAIKASQAKAEFLSVMSHEIRTPMNAVVGLTYLLLQEQPRKDQIENLTTIKFSAENLLTIINDILDFSKIESGKLSLESSRMNLKYILNSIHHSLSNKAQDKNIGLIKKVDPAIPDYVFGDAVRVAQVINNLLGNAIKFTKDGHVELEAVLVKNEEEVVEVNFSISDTGIGIPEDKVDMIFDTFTQASSNTTRKFGGTGLGLTITKKLLELHGSTIQVESEMGKGTRFYFSVKFKKCSEKDIPKELETQEQKSSLEKSLKGISILLVEDNKINQLVAKKFISRWGASLKVAENGLEAVELVKEEAFDIILMDLQMPIMGGLEATVKIRELGGDYKTLPIVALTASAVLEVQDEALAAKMNDFITKPFDPHTLLSKIQKLTSKEGIEIKSNLA